MADYPVSIDLVRRKLLEMRDGMEPDAIAVLNMAISKLEGFPAMDVVQVVRCRECKYMRPLEHDGFVACIMWCRAMHSNGFCYEGRKKGAKDMDATTKEGGGG